MGRYFLPGKQNHDGTTLFTYVARFYTNSISGFVTDLSPHVKDSLYILSSQLHKTITATFLQTKNLNKLATPPFAVQYNAIAVVCHVCMHVYIKKCGPLQLLIEECI